MQIARKRFGIDMLMTRIVIRVGMVPDLLEIYLTYGNRFAPVIFIKTGANSSIASSCFILGPTLHPIVGSSYQLNAFQK